MKFTDAQYEEKKSYIKGLVSLGGMSECGKTSAGVYFDKMGIKRIKIIHIEKEMMAERKYDITNGYTDFHFDSLYEDNEEGFREFLFRLIEKLQIENIKYASIESLYRSQLGVFLKKELGNRMLNIYIEAPVEIRVKREMLKRNTVDEVKSKHNFSYEEILHMVKEKDNFKQRRGADRVKDIADIIIYNDEDVTLKEFYRIVDGIGQSLLSKFS